jgi:branched-chain amino acid transport system permease protein
MSGVAAPTPPAAEISTPAVSAVESQQRRRSATEVLVTAVAVGLVALWMGENDYRASTVVLTAMYALTALGMYVPFMMGGWLSVAYSAYLAAGAYAVAIVGNFTSLPLTLAFALAFVASAIMATVLGYLTRRISGFYLAAVTLLFAIAFQSWLRSGAGIPGGSGTISSLREARIGRVVLDTRGLALVALLVSWVVAILLSRFRRSAVGIVIRAQREAAVAVEATGVSTTVLKLVTLAAGAGIASIGGGLFALSNRAIDPDAITLDIVFLATFMPLLGGGRSPWGAVIGAVLITEFTFNLPIVGDSGSLMFALAVLLVLVLAPQGLLGLAASTGRRATSALQRWRPGRART